MSLPSPLSYTYSVHDVNVNVSAETKNAETSMQKPRTRRIGGFFKEQALRPCSNSRSRDSAQIRQIESSVRPNLTALVTKQGPDTEGANQEYTFKKHVFPHGNHQPEKRSFKNDLFLSFFFSDPTRTSISFFPAGGPNVIESNNRTNGSPPFVIQRTANAVPLPRHKVGRIES